VVSIRREKHKTLTLYRFGRGAGKDFVDNSPGRDSGCRGRWSGGVER